MIVYFDTSSLVKLYVEEEGSSDIRALVDRASVAATSVVAYAEARAALARQHRAGALTAAEFVRAKADFEADWNQMLALALTEPIYRRAGELAEKHHLRGFDGLHLASFVTLCERSDGTAIFSCHDKALSLAARREARTL